VGKVYEALCGLARRTGTSFFSELRADSTLRSEAPEAADGLIYRLREWPTLPSSQRTADVLRLLSLMSNRPVNRSWMVNHTSVAPERLDRLLERLVADGSLEVIDSSRFAAAPPAPKARA
jgi:hypothetical protein